MRITVQADDGDEVSISADVISAEQALLTLTIESTAYDSAQELESLTLTVEKARELAKALVSVAEAIEFVNAPAGSLDWPVDTADAAISRAASQQKAHQPA
jgi:hypothetical protein